MIFAAGKFRPCYECAMQSGTIQGDVALTKFADREPFELCSAEHMMDDAATVVSSVKALDNPQTAVAEMLSHVANVGYLLALDDMRKGIEAAGKWLHNGHPAITGMRMAETKIAYVCGEVREFMKGEAEKAGVEEASQPPRPM